MKRQLLAFSLLISSVLSVNAAELNFDKTLMYAQQHFQIPGNFEEISVIGKDINLVSLQYPQQDAQSHYHIAFSEVDVASAFSAQCSTKQLLQAAYEKIKTGCDGKSVHLFTLATITDEVSGVITVAGRKHYYSHLKSGSTVIYTLGKKGKAVKITTNMLQPEQLKELFTVK